MGLSTGAMIATLVVGGIAAILIGKKLASGNSNPDVRDESINNEYNISGGRSRRNRQHKNKSRRR